MSADKADKLEYAGVPMRWVGPAGITGPVVNEEVSFPLATYESPLWPSTNRGARVSTVCGGIHAVVIDERMTRSILVQAPDAAKAAEVARSLPQHRTLFDERIAQHSRFAKLIDIHTQQAGDLLFIRLEYTTGDAAGHNMVTAASEQVLEALLELYPALRYVSISGNLCTDKKASAVNGILGRGKYVVTEMLIPRKICARYLKTTPEKMAELNVKKNLIGTMLAGGLRSANAHFANMLLGFYLATGQDAANIVEGSQGFVHAEVREEALYFSATLPNIIVGTVGNGKQLDFVQQNLERLGCTGENEPGANARRLAVIAAVAVCCGELSLMAAQTNPGELMQAHLRMERSS